VIDARLIEGAARTIPMKPGSRHFLIAARASAVVAIFAVSLLALFLIGLLTSFFNRRSLVF